MYCLLDKKGRLQRFGSSLEAIKRPVSLIGDHFPAPGLLNATRGHLFVAGECMETNRRAPISLPKKTVQKN
jgi:hypothetical protein